MDRISSKGQERVGSQSTGVIDLSEKLERLKRGLRADTVSLPAHKYPSLKGSLLAYSLKSGCFGAYDPLRKRSKLFRQSVARYAPPYYFWHKEFTNTRKLKAISPNDTQLEETEPDSRGQVRCVWCQLMTRHSDYELHKTKRCKLRFDFLGNGFYRCWSCKEGFIDESKAKEHIKLHFPSMYQNGNHSSSMNKKLSIICRDHAKRKKWL